MERKARASPHGHEAGCAWRLHHSSPTWFLRLTLSLRSAVWSRCRLLTAPSRASFWPMAAVTAVLSSVFSSNREASRSLV